MPQTLSDIYRDKCQEYHTVIEEQTLKAYQQLDDVIGWIEQSPQPHKKLYHMSILADPLFTIPIQKAKQIKTLSNLPEGYYDVLDQNGKPAIYAMGLSDLYRTTLLNRLLVEEEDSCLTLQWKWRRLQQYYKLGVDEYKKQYKI